MKKYLYKLSQGLFIVGLLTLALTACKEEEENMTFSLGNQLFISGSGNTYSGAEGVRYYVENDHIDKTYTWSATGGATIQTDPENDAFVYVDFPDPGTYEITAFNGATEGTITVEAKPKVVSLGAKTATGLEYNGDSNDTVRVPIAITDPTYANKNPTTSVTTIHYTISGNAVEGVDYELLSANPLVLPAGFDADTTINIKLLDDMVLEEKDSIVVDLISVSDVTDNQGIILTDSTALTNFIFYIVDDIKYLSFEAVENDTLRSDAAAGNYAFNVNLSLPAKAEVTVPYTISGAGVTSAMNELKFKAGTTSQLLTINIDDAAFASNQEVKITLGDPISDDKEVMIAKDEEDVPVGNEVVIVIETDD